MLRNDLLKGVLFALFIVPAAIWLDGAISDKPKSPKTKTTYFDNQLKCPKCDTTIESCKPHTISNSIQQ